MNQELTTAQKARVFALYIGQQVRSAQYASSGRLVSVDVRSDQFDVEWEPYTSSSDGIQLLLRPLSAITDDDAVEVARIHNWSAKKDPESVWIGRAIVVHHFTAVSAFDESDFDSAKNRSTICDMNSYVALLVIQFLIQRGYAVPLFIAPGHPCNGMTAIEMGLAIDSTAQEVAS